MTTRRKAADPGLLPDQVMRRMLDASREFQRLRPWKTMWDTVFVGCRDERTGELRICSVLGAAAEVFGMVSYRGTEGLGLVHALVTQEHEPTREQLLRGMNCLKLDRAEIPVVGLGDNRLTSQEIDWTPLLPPVAAVEDVLSLTDREADELLRLPMRQGGVSEVETTFLHAATFLDKAGLRRVPFADPMIMSSARALLDGELAGVREEPAESASTRIRHKVNLPPGYFTISMKSRPNSDRSQAPKPPLKCSSPSMVPTRSP